MEGIRCDVFSAKNEGGGSTLFGGLDMNNDANPSQFSENVGTLQDHTSEVKIKISKLRYTGQPTHRAQNFASFLSFRSIIVTKSAKSCQNFWQTRVNFFRHVGSFD
jgi:hypothetical protein